MSNHNDTPLELFHRGLPFDHGACPTLLYFAAGGKESLNEEPFCQPVDLFLDGKTRILTVDLPFHGEGYDKMKAMGLWALSLVAEDDFIGRFITQVGQLLDKLKSEGLINPSKFAVAGLSRGGFLATLAAAEIPWLNNVLAFAPVTVLPKLEGFEKLSDNKIVQKWSLSHKAELLAQKKIRYYIGNYDTRVDTDSCYSLVRNIVRKGKAASLRTVDTELVIYPSVGQKGHGTPPHIFEAGITWLKGFLEY
ncbi:MAG: hypothetical protein WC222_01125 [Parachlamydiales bacterium]|jgi:esterase FrsA